MYNIDNTCNYQRQEYLFVFEFSDFLAKNDIAQATVVFVCI
jgi:hypothetical protein